MTPQETHRRVQASLEGKCVFCGGIIPRHIGLCHIKTRQLQLNFEERRGSRGVKLKKVEFDE